MRSAPQLGASDHRLLGSAVIFDGPSLAATASNHARRTTQTRLPRIGQARQSGEHISDTRIAL